MFCPLENTLKEMSNFITNNLKYLNIGMNDLQKAFTIIILRVQCVFLGSKKSFRGKSEYYYI